MGSKVTVKVSPRTNLIVGAGFSVPFGIPAATLLSAAIDFFQNNRNQGGLFHRYPDGAWTAHLQSVLLALQKGKILDPEKGFESVISKIITAHEVAEYHCRSELFELVNHFKRIVAFFILEKSISAVQNNLYAEKITHLLGLLGPSSNILTLNYDLILDSYVRSSSHSNFPQIFHLHGSVDKWVKEGSPYHEIYINNPSGYGPTTTYNLNSHELIIVNWLET